MEQKGKRLEEVTLMRSVCALLIVFMHSFTCYNGGWPEPDGFVNVTIYKWLSRFSFAFTLQSFVFISGYLFAFQMFTQNRVIRFPDLVINKLKRLILPSIIFSIIYYCLFYEYKGLVYTLYSIIAGCGHMWYLPMLFWCFLGELFFVKIKINECWKILFLIFINLLAIYTLPLQINRAASFMVYFHGGFLFQKYSDKIKESITKKRLFLSWLAFVIFFALLRPMRDVLDARLSGTISIIANHACQLLYSWVGLIAFYGTVVYHTKKCPLSNIAVKIAGCSFGIYLFQQFILQILYYKTDFPTIVGPYWLPWCGFVMALLFSYIFSVLLLRTKVGKYLIG